MIFTTPAVALIRERFDVKIDGSPDCVARAIGDGRQWVCSAPRNKGFDQAMIWRALGYEVQIRFDGYIVGLTNPRGWRDFPASQEEAVVGLRELAERRWLGRRRWQQALVQLNKESDTKSP